jgi:hypothetical protein
MSKLDTLALAFNSDLAAQRADEIGKILSAINGAGCLEAARQEIEKIHNNYWRIECEKEERFRKQYQTTAAI